MREFRQMATAPAETTDASQWEYVTYAPSGQTCPACMRPIKSLERVHRGEFSLARTRRSSSCRTGDVVSSVSTDRRTDSRALAHPRGAGLPPASGLRAGQVRRVHSASMSYVFMASDSESFPVTGRRSL